MQLNSKSIALILAACISTIISGSLFLFPTLPPYMIWLIGLISFGTSYILINVVLEFLFFREMRGIYEMFEKIRDNNFSSMQRNKRFSFNSFRQIHHELYDYAQNKQSEIDELKQLAKFRRQFLADVSHELKTPIFAAQGFVYTLIDGAIDDKENRMKFLKKAAKNLDGLDALVQDLLTVSHMEAGDITMHMEAVNLVEIIYEIFDQLEHTAHKGEVILTLNLPRKSAIYALADIQRIRQVLLNLITNAIKYSKVKGEVAATITEKAANIEVVIKDNGIGIPKEHLNRIFERFYRVDKSRSKAIGGTGLGLSIVKHILEAHNSEIKVKSIVEQGSEFSFLLNKYDHKNLHS